ncbi:MAG: circularly permuted type 2 ATP-grasp protein [Paracoccaceae bacterium]
MPKPGNPAPVRLDPLAGYRPLPGVPDELMTPNGALRPGWGPLMRLIADLKPEEIQHRFARGNQYLRDAGVFFRQYGDGDSPERDWPLNHVPVVIPEYEWQALAAGLIQRADLLERVVADLYGPNHLVADGHLPAGLIAQSPEWLRPMVGVTPRGGHFLNFLSFEIGRGPDGQWWVLGDRTQAPSGAGFALENRVATARVFSDLYAQSNVLRLAGFFRAFRNALEGMHADHTARSAILTPGPLNDTYFEHAYIARYLGLMLLEGEDLTVQNGHLMVRTVAGPEPVSVLWRRLDAQWMDPLELNGASTLGVPGLVDAVRRGNLTVVNALGSGVLETRALLAFLPRICPALTGQPLAIPNIATWWCGSGPERAHVLQNADRMLIGPALSTRAPFEADTGAAGWFRAAPDAPLAERLEKDGALLVGQEAVTLSTTPVWVDGKMEPRPMALRVFLARTREGWQVMPGGYARIGRSDDPTALAMQRGGSVADVWIVSDRPVERETLVARPASYQRPDQGTLPARAADNLFWLGRYVERAEGTMRLLRAWHLRLSETADPSAPLLADLTDYLDDYDIDPAEKVPDALHATLGSAIYSASKIRDRFSVDGWMALNELARTARRMSGTLTPGSDGAGAMRVLLRKISGFSGLVHENMYRFTGWRFLSIGRSLERAGSMAAILARFADEAAPEGGLDLAVELGDSVMTHRRRYTVSTSRETVVDLLALDGMNPRAILYQLADLRDQIALLPGAEDRGRLSEPAKAILKLHTGLAVMGPEEVTTDALLAIGDALGDLSNLISDQWLR